MRNNGRRALRPALSASPSSPSAPGALPAAGGCPSPSALGATRVRRPHFRFEDLEIWQLAKDLAVRFHKVADDLEQRRLYRYAEQIRAAGLAVPNNIAEGSGSLHEKEFHQFLNIARRSVFENASMLLVFEAMELIDSAIADKLLCRCDEQSRKITNFQRTLTKGK